MERHIDLRKLKRGTTLMLETQLSVFEIKVTGPKTGKILIEGSLRFLEPSAAKILGSVDSHEGDKEINLTVEKLVIRQDKCLEIVYGDKYGKKFKTTPILSARIYGKGWHFDVIEREKAVE